MKTRLSTKAGWRHAILLGTVLLQTAACRSDPSSSALRFESATTVAVDATIDEGLIFSFASTPAEQLREIKAQLMYATGQLGRAEASMASMGSLLNVRITGTEPQPEGGQIVRYQASFLVAWRRPADVAEVPDTYTLILPARADAGGLKYFVNAYKKYCGGSGGPNDFYYYYNPKKADCPLSWSTAPLDAVRVSMRMRLNANNSEGKYPEYGRIWDDQRLVVTFVGHAPGIPLVGHEPGSESAGVLHTDPGVRLIQLLTREYGQPLTHTEELLDTYRVSHAEFEVDPGRIVVRALDIQRGSVRTMKQDFIDRYRAFTVDADLVAYNGHAGLGANINKLGALTVLSPERYYLFWINACQPFAYLDNSYFAAATRANPGQPASRHLDLMLSTGIGTFAFGTDVKLIVDALVKRMATFRELTAALGRGEPAVMGEEDNVWPEAWR